MPDAKDREHCMRVYKKSYFIRDHTEDCVYFIEVSTEKTVAAVHHVL